MQIFQNQHTGFFALTEVSFRLERDIQKVFEANLEKITGFKLVKSEFTIKNYRIDTLAFDEESKSFIIIEYKKERNYSVVDQGVSYLNLLLEYKADFIVEYNESQNGNLKRTDVDWSQTKVIFVSPSFTLNQIQATNFKDLPIELWTIKQFENNIIVVNPIKKSNTAPSIKPVQQLADSKISKVAKEIVVYDEEYHLTGKSEDIRELYEAYKHAILALSPSLEVKPKKLYISFETDKIILDIVVLKSVLKLYISNKNGLEDLAGITEEVKDQTKWGRGYSLVQVKDTIYLEYIMSIVKQAL